jgi:hypothetical protein
MINPKELRIGNWIKYNSDRSLKPELINTWLRVTADVIKWASNPSENCYEPILLTPEIWERCGFDNVNSVFVNCKKIGKEILINIVYGKEKHGYALLVDESIVGEPFQYLHELQNICLDLFKIEFEIKELQHA